MSAPEQASAVDVLLRTHGLRTTASRRASYAALREMPHATASSVYERVRATVPTTSMQSVYNALNDFVAAGLARRITPDGGAARYETRTGDNHHHLICRDCGRVADVDHAIDDLAGASGGQLHGFTVDSAEVTFWGRCADCLAASVA